MKFKDKLLKLKKRKSTPKKKRKPRKKPDPEIQAKYESVKEFVKQLGQECSRKLNCRVTFKLHSKSPKHGIYCYSEKQDGIEKGRIIIKFRELSGNPYIDNCYVLNGHAKEALKDLNLMKPIKITKTENKWKRCKS